MKTQTRPPTLLHLSFTARVKCTLETTRQGFFIPYQQFYFLILTLIFYDLVKVKYLMFYLEQDEMEEMQSRLKRKCSNQNEI